MCQKWVDEDEQEGAPDDDYMGGMGGDFGGMGGLDFSKLGGGAGMGGDDMEGLGGDSVSPYRERNFHVLRAVSINVLIRSLQDDDDMPDLEGEGAAGNVKDKMEDDDGADTAVPPEKDSHATSSGDVEQVPEATGETGASATKTAAKIEELS